MATIADYQQAVVGMSPRLYWHLNDGSGTQILDVSGYGNHGSVGTYGSWKLARKSNWGLWSLYSDTGTQTFGHTMALPTDSSSSEWWSLMFWYKMPDSSVNETVITVDLIGSGNILRLHRNGFLYLNATSTVSSAVKYDNWIPVIFIKQFGIISVYMDIDATAAFSANNTAPFASTTGVNVYTGYPAYISNFAFWDRALTAGEIQTLTAQPFFTDTIPASTMNVIESEPATYFERVYQPLDWNVVLVPSSTPVKVALGGQITASITIGLEPNKVGGTVTAVTELSGTLTLTTIVQFFTGTISGYADLSGTLSLKTVGEIPIEGSLEDITDLSGSIWLTNQISGSIEDITDLVGEITLVTSMSGSIEADTVFEDAALTLRAAWFADAASATLTISTVGIDGAVYTYLTPSPIEAFLDFNLGYSCYNPLPIPTPPTVWIPPTPPDPGTPEDAEEADPTLNTGITIRPLMGIIVDMDVPTIVDGKPV